MDHDDAMGSNDLFGGPKRLLTVIAVIVVVAVLAALATLLVRHLLGPPEGPSPYETTSMGTSVSISGHSAEHRRLETV